MHNMHCIVTLQFPIFTLYYITCMYIRYTFLTNVNIFKRLCCLYFGDWGALINIYFFLLWNKAPYIIKTKAQSIRKIEICQKSTPNILYVVHHTTHISKMYWLKNAILVTTVTYAAPALAFWPYFLLLPLLLIFTSFSNIVCLEKSYAGNMSIFWYL